MSEQGQEAYVDHCDLISQALMERILQFTEESMDTVISSDGQPSSGKAQPEGGVESMEEDSNGGDGFLTVDGGGGGGSGLYDGGSGPPSLGSLSLSSQPTSLGQQPHSLSISTGIEERERERKRDNSMLSFFRVFSIPGSATPTTATTPTGPSLTTRLSTQTGVEGALAYLLDCHERATHEERFVSKRGSATEKKAVLAQCKECCVTHSALLLQGYFGPINVPARNDDSYNFIVELYNNVSDISDFQVYYLTHIIVCSFLLHMIFSLSLPLSLSHTHTHTHTLTLTLSLSHTHTHTHMQ